MVFLSALKPPGRVLDSTHLDHTARQHWVDRHAPYSPVPVLNSSLVNTTTTTHYYYYYYYLYYYYARIV